MFRPGQTHQALWKPQGVYARLVHFDGACCNCQGCSAFVFLVGQALQKVEESMIIYIYIIIYIIHTTQPIGGSSIGGTPRNPSCVFSWRYPNVGKRPTGMHWKHTMTWELISSLGCILAAWLFQRHSMKLGAIFRGIGQCSIPNPRTSPLADLKPITRFAFKDSTSLCSWEKPCYPSSEIQHHTIFLLSPGLHGIYGICLPVCWFLRPINKSWHPKTCPWRREKLWDSCLRWVHATEAHLTACARWCSPVIYKLVRNSHELMDEISTLNHPKPLIGVMFANLANYGARACRWTFSWVIVRSLPWGSVYHGSAKFDHDFFPSLRVFVVDPVRQTIKIPVGIQRMMSISIMSNFDPYLILG